MAYQIRNRTKRIDFDQIYTYTGDSMGWRLNKHKDLRKRSKFYTKVTTNFTSNIHRESIHQVPIVIGYYNWVLKPMFFWLRCKQTDKNKKINQRRIRNPRWSMIESDYEAVEGIYGCDWRWFYRGYWCLTTRTFHDIIGFFFGWWFRYLMQTRDIIYQTSR